MTPTALDTANVFLGLSEPEVGDLITNLKIQKLVYYAQGFHLAIYDGKPLFNDDIVAWIHGPVVESLYHTFKGYGSNAIPIPEDIDTSRFSEEQLDLISEVNKIYGQFSAWKLRDLTHTERPWKETPTNAIISKGLLQDFFSTQLIDG